MSEISKIVRDYIRSNISKFNLYTLPDDFGNLKKKTVKLLEQNNLSTEQLELLEGCLIKEKELIKHNFNTIYNHFESNLIKLIKGYDYNIDELKTTITYYIELYVPRNIVKK